MNGPGPRRAQRGFPCGDEAPTATPERDSGAGRRLALAAHKAVFVQAVLNGAHADVKELRSLRCRAVGRLQRRENRQTLDLRHRRARYADGALYGLSGLERQVVGFDLRLLAENDGTFDRVFELPHVARPTVSEDLVFVVN